MPDPAHAAALERDYEVRPDPQALTANTSDPSTPGDPSQNSSTNVDYEPHPERSIKVSAARQRILQAITGLYSGSKSEEDIQVYAKDCIYDDPLSFCDTRYKVAGQWWGIPQIFSSSKTLATEVVESTPRTLIFKLRQEYTPKIIHTSKTVNSLITLTLEPDPDDAGETAGGEAGDQWKFKVKYHKDMWNEKDYSHTGFGRWWKELNGDHLTAITKPPEWLKEDGGKPK